MFKLLESGVDGKMYYIIKSLYDMTKTEASIKINEYLTDWFVTTQGVKQGDSLSPILFILFINGLAKHLQELGFGIDMNGRKVPILLYADDIVLISKNEKELQAMINFVKEWCDTWLMSINLTKTKIVHFRKKNVNRSEVVFKYGDKDIDYVDCYKYLGIYFDEHLKFQYNDQELSKAGSRALGAIINKMKNSQCMGYEAYTKCIESCLFPILDYGSEIIGYTKSPKLEQVENRAARSFLGVHRFSAKAAVCGDIGWTPNSVRQKLNMLRYWNRLLVMKDERLTKLAFNINYEQANECDNWCHYVRQILVEIQCEELYLNKESCDLKHCKILLLELFDQRWQRDVFWKPKLRFYRQLKPNICVEKYVQLNIPQRQRSLLAQLRFGILPLRIETGRYINLKPEERLCQQCDTDDTEDEMHFLFSCPLYVNERNNFLTEIYNVCPHAANLSNLDLLKLCFEMYVRKLGRYIDVICQKRKDNIYN